MKKVLLILCALMVTQLAGAWYLVGGSPLSWEPSAGIQNTTTDGSLEVWESVNLNNNQEFKFVKEKNWNTSLGSGSSITGTGKTTTLYLNGGNCKWTGAAGVYTIKLDVNGKKLYIEESTVPPEVLEIPDGVFSFYEGETVAFFVNNLNWSKVNAYAWEGTTGEVAGWPGQAMTVVDGVSINNKYNAYKWTCTKTGAPGKIIFNNGSAQTSNLAFVNGGVYDANGNLLKTITPTVALEPTVTLNYSPEAIYTNTTVTLSATVLDGDGMTVEYLVNDEKLSGNKWTPTTAGSYTLTANLVDGTTVKATDSKTVTVKESTLFTVYLEQSSAWTTTYIYCWGGYGNTWPGEKLTATETVNGVAYYKWDFKNIESVNIIFTDNSGNQTADISNVTKTTYYRLKGKTGKPCGHEEVDPTVKPETLVYNVTVPAHTFECYIVGEFNEWGTFVPMEKVDDTHYTITLDNVYKTSKYKYTSGKGWDYVEKTAAGEEIQDRTYQANDVVAKWNKKPAVEEHIVAGRMYSLNLGEDSEWENPVMQTARRKAAPTAFELFEDFDDDTHFANGGIVPDGWLSTGAMAPKREKAGLYETGYDAHSGSYMLNTLDQSGSLRDEVLYTPMVKLAGGKEATISFYIYAPGGSPAMFYSYVDVKAGTAQSLDAQTIALGATSSAHPSWTELKYVFTPEADGEYCFSIAMKHSTDLSRDHGFIGIDDVTITGYTPAEGGSEEPEQPENPEQPAEPVAFESFEDFDDASHFANGGIAPDGWLSTGGQALTRFQGGAWYTGYDAHSGDYVMHSEHNSAGRDEILYTPMMKLAGGKEATISFYLIAPGGSPASAFYAQVSVKVGTAQTADALTVDLGTTSTYYSTWHELKYTFTPAEDGEYCFAIALGLSSLNYGRTHGYVGIDDVTITGYTPAEGGSDEPEQPVVPEGDFWYAAKFINYNTGAYTWAKADSYDAEYNSYMFYLAEGNMPATRAAEDNKYTHVQFVQYASEEVAPENLHTLTLANATNKTGELYFDGTTSTVYDLQNEVWKAIGTMLDEVEAEPTIEYAGYVVFAEGAIEVYNLNGVVVARGYDSVDLRNQVRGIYIVRAGEQVRKVVR